MNNSLGKKERLKSKKAVSEIFGAQKSSVKAFPFRAFYSITESQRPIAKFGIAVPKKKFKRAVDRNRVKRLVKESIRTNKFDLNNELKKSSLSMNIMIVCQADNLPSFNTVELKIKEVLKKLSQVVIAYEKE